MYGVNGRAWALGGVVLLGSLLAGCTGPEPLVDLVGPLDPAVITAAGGVIEPTPTGALVRWLGPLELEKPFTVAFPSTVTRVDATWTDPGGAASALALYNAHTGRIRCQPDRTVAWFTPTSVVTRCSGLTVMDPGPHTWRTSTGIRGLPAGAAIELELSTEPLDGQAARIRLDALAMPRHEALSTQVMQVAATSDGADLHVEVTRPDTNERVPTILVSSPYNQGPRLAGLRPENSTIANWVPRGYAVVSADVRGFGLSGGCVEVWGPKEQQDQVDLVEWIAAQPWSNGKVGFYGQSYVGTTPVEAASLGAPHLTTILTIAPVINAYEDWHFGGVPNGENAGSPAGYQASDTLARLPVTGLLAQDPELALAEIQATTPEGLLAAADQLGRGLCDPTLAARANDPRAIYDPFYAERDFKAKAENVKASVFYTQGFYDENVKSQMIPGWFDALNVTKKGLFGDWIHQHPPRADQELLFHAWFDEWLMERDTGILETPVVEVRTNVDTVRTDATWPPTDTALRRLGLDLDASRILATPVGSGSADYLAQAAPVTQPLPLGAVAPTRLVLEGDPVPQRMYVAGQPELHLRAKLSGVENTFFYAGLYDVAPDATTQLITFGMHNAALRNGYERYDPVPPDQTIDYRLPFLVTEYVLQAGHRLRLEIRAADALDWFLTPPTAPGVVTLEGGEGTALVLPTLADPGDVPAPKTAGPTIHP